MPLAQRLSPKRTPASICPKSSALRTGTIIFVRILQQRFPEVHVLWMDAARLRDVTLFGWGETGAVVSGLPLLSMPPRKVMAILEGAFTHLRPSGDQFTYWPHCPISERILDRLDLRAVHCGTAIANIPPAYVYRIVRERSAPVRSPHRVECGKKQQNQHRADSRSPDQSVGH